MIRRKLVRQASECCGSGGGRGCPLIILDFGTATTFIVRPAFPDRYFGYLCRWGNCPCVYCRLRRWLPAAKLPSLVLSLTSLPVLGTSTQGDEIRCIMGLCWLIDGLLTRQKQSRVCQKRSLLVQVGWPHYLRILKL